MIKFFRRIRQKLLSENKFSKYLLYAIGDIFFVVVGILIALYINSLNEAPKVYLLKKDLLSEMKSGLKYDLDQLKKTFEFHRVSLKSQNIILNWVDRKIDYNDSLGLHFLHAIVNRNIMFIHPCRPKEICFNDLLNQFGKTVSLWDTN